MSITQTSFYFRLPAYADGYAKPDGIAALLAAFPNRFSYLKGSLVPEYTQLLKPSPQVAMRTGWEFQPHGAFRPIGVRFEDHDGLRHTRHHQPELFELLCAEPRLHPRLIQFDDAGYHALEESSLAFPKLIQIASYYVSTLNYTGWLELRSQLYGWGSEEERVSLSMRLHLLSERVREQHAPRQQPHIRIEFYPRHGGSLREASPVLDACHKLGLSPYEPAPGAQVPLAL